MWSNMSNTKLSREHLGLAAEFAVASELCRRGFYAQLTLGMHKSTDILIEGDQGMLRVQVKAKSGREWPNCAGISKRDFVLVLVDFAGKGTNERPDFYVLDFSDWIAVANKEIELQCSRGREVVMDERNTPIWPKQITKNGQPYRGISIKPSQVGIYKENWSKIETLLGSS